MNIISFNNIKDEFEPGEAAGVRRSWLGHQQAHRDGKSGEEGLSVLLIVCTDRNDVALLLRGLVVADQTAVAKDDSPY
jgi:hypothetical protein